MKLIGQILPYVRKALKQNQHDAEAKELIRQLELSVVTTAHESEAPKHMQSRLEQLEDELNELKQAHSREIICM